MGWANYPLKMYPKNTCFASIVNRCVGGLVKNSIVLKHYGNITLSFEIPIHSVKETGTTYYTICTNYFERYIDILTIVYTSAQVQDNAINQSELAPTFKLVLVSCSSRLN